MTQQSSSHTTTDREEIRRWAEERGGVPAVVEGTEKQGQGVGLLRIKFSEESDDKLKEISWDVFFEELEKDHLKFLYQSKTKDGKLSRFFKIVRDND